MISGMSLTPLKKVDNDKGGIFHILKSSDPGFSAFGEAYFSTVICNEIKGWKKHTKMKMNLVVPVGEIKFVFFDDRKESETLNSFYSINMSLENYCRITVPENIWMAFQGISKGTNLLLNIANIEHDPDEAINASLQDIDYDWSVYA